jgi:hypothetical protein
MMFPVSAGYWEHWEQLGGLNPPLGQNSLSGEMETRRGYLEKIV